MKIQYLLSRRQLKELSRGNTIRIALPYPDEGIEGAYRHHDGMLDGDCAALATWFRRHLDAAEARYDIAAIEIVDVPVEPLSRNSGLGALVGQVRRSRECWSLRVVCVVATLALPGARRPRGVEPSDYPTQWPGAVRFDDGAVLPSP